ncbi:unnamed protein product [Polarella glacialis]|uniref:Uncharacterized protein n=1 Tax=Polarella glacialis TaxID=89957 RepID=A0A813JUZ5_POLGL|nr:unnamed protein product [Polarella glacialis]
MLLLLVLVVFLVAWSLRLRSQRSRQPQTSRSQVVENETKEVVAKSKGATVTDKKHEKKVAKVHADYSDADLLEDVAEDGENEKVDPELAENPKVPAQGYEGKKVRHVDGKTITQDWRKEYGPGMNPKPESTTTEVPTTTTNSTSTTTSTFITSTSTTRKVTTTPKKSSAFRGTVFAAVLTILAIMI